MPYTGEQIADQVVTTQRNLGRMKWTDLKHDLQDFVVMPSILKKERIMFDGGTASRFQLQTRTNGTARVTGLFDTNNTNQPDTMTFGYVPFCHVDASYSYDERQPEMNSGEAKIVDFVKTQRVACLADLAELFESLFWNKPVDSTDQLTPWGVPMFVVKDNTATAAFTGGNPSGWSSGYASVSTTTYPRWDNWAGGYTNIADNDLVDKMRSACDHTMFKSPVANPNYDMGSARRMLYTGYTVKQGLDRLARQQNDQLGYDIDPSNGRTTFRKMEVQWVPYLDADTTNPVYGLDWSTITTIFLKGEYLKELPPQTAPNQHRVKDVFIDCSFNWRCHNRRRNWVLSV